MTENDVDIRLIGYSAFKASTRFLCSLEDEIYVERWGTPFRKFRVDRVPSIRSGEDLRRALELSCLISVVSAHVDVEGTFSARTIRATSA